MKICIVSPHADDELLSCSSVLANSSHQIDLLNVFTNVYAKRAIHKPHFHWSEEFLEKRSPEKLKLYFDSIKNVTLLNFTGANYANAMLNSELNAEILKIRNFKKAVRLFDIDEERNTAVIVNRAILDFPELEIELFKNLQGYDLVLCPIGILHNDHLIVRKSVDKVIKTPIAYYADIPYAYRKGGDRLLSDDIEHHKYEYSQKHESCKNKKKILWKVYPREQVMLWCTHSAVDVAERFYSNHKIIQQLYSF